jgi:hypothetical protein
MSDQNKITIEVDIKWARLIALAERAKFSKATIVFKKGVPTDIDVMIPHIKLDMPDKDFDEVKMQFELL